jgi:hypothetical protein
VNRCPPARSQGPAVAQLEVGVSSRLSRSGRRDECARRCQKDGGRFLRRKHLWTDEGAVDRQGQLGCQLIWALRALTTSYSPRSVYPSAVRLRRRAMVDSNFGRTFGRVHGHSAMQMPHDADSAK